MNNFAQSFDPEAPVPESIASIGQTLDDIDSLLSKFLVCSTPQRALLALWIAHTYCYRAFSVTPYLEIYSPEKQSGKTVCLRLLQFLSNNAWSPVGVNTGRLITRIASSQPTLLLDNWDTLFRASGHQSIVGFLDAGATEGSYHSFNAEDDTSDFSVFCPKAFAGHQRLPAPLANRCIPILLRRLKDTEQVLPFWRDLAFDEALALRKALRAWGEESRELLRQTALQVLSDPEPGLVKREFTIPLVIIASIAGDKWIRKLQVALIRTFASSLAQPPSVGLQLLTDIRSFFTLNNDPPRIHTAPLLEYLNILEERPWKKLTPNSLRLLLQDFPIPRTGSQRIGRDTSKGFTFRHFVESWESYLPQVSSKRSPQQQPAQSQVATNEGQVATNEGQVATNATQTATNGGQTATNCLPETNNFNDFNTCVFGAQLSRD